MNVLITFLYKFLDKTVYIIQQTLLEMEKLQNLVFFLQKMLYRLK